MSNVPVFCMAHNSSAPCCWAKELWLERLLEAVYSFSYLLRRWESSSIWWLIWSCFESSSCLSSRVKASSTHYLGILSYYSFEGFSFFSSRAYNVASKFLRMLSNSVFFRFRLDNLSLTSTFDEVCVSKAPSSMSLASGAWFGLWFWSIPYS